MMLLVYYLMNSVVGGAEVEVRPPLGDLGPVLFSKALLVPGVASWLSHEELTKFEGGLGHELLPPGAVLRQGSPFGEGRREVEVCQVALKRLAVGHFLVLSQVGRKRTMTMTNWQSDVSATEKSCVVHYAYTNEN